MMSRRAAREEDQRSGRLLTQDNPDRREAVEEQIRNRPFTVIPASWPGSEIFEIEHFGVERDCEDQYATTRSIKRCTVLWSSELIRSTQVSIPRQSVS